MFVSKKRYEALKRRWERVFDENLALHEEAFDAEAACEEWKAKFRAEAERAHKADKEVSEMRLRYDPPKKFSDNVFVYGLTNSAVVSADPSQPEIRRYVISVKRGLDSLDNPCIVVEARKGGKVIYSLPVKNPRMIEDSIQAARDFVETLVRITPDKPFTIEVDV